jgi:hypothetical protein
VYVVPPNGLDDTKTLTCQSLTNIKLLAGHEALAITQADVRDIRNRIYKEGLDRGLTLLATFRDITIPTDIRTRALESANQLTSDEVSLLVWRHVLLLCGHHVYLDDNFKSLVKDGQNSEAFEEQLQSLGLTLSQLQPLIKELLETRARHRELNDLIQDEFHQHHQLPHKLEEVTHFGHVLSLLTHVLRVRANFDLSSRIQMVRDTLSKYPGFKELPSALKSLSSERKFHGYVSHPDLDELEWCVTI